MAGSSHAEQYEAQAQPGVQDGDGVEAIGQQRQRGSVDQEVPADIEHAIRVEARGDGEAPTHWGSA
jgi:hypothetical protein